MDGAGLERLVLLMLVAMLWMSVDTIFNPLPQDAGKSVGLLFVQNIVCIDPILIIGSYLMLDRRRIARGVPPWRDGAFCAKPSTASS